MTKEKDKHPQFKDDVKESKFIWQITKGSLRSSFQSLQKLRKIW